MKNNLLGASVSSLRHPDPDNRCKMGNYPLLKELGSFMNDEQWSTMPATCPLIGDSSRSCFYHNTTTTTNQPTTAATALVPTNFPDTIDVNHQVCKTIPKLH